MRIYDTIARGEIMFDIPRRSPDRPGEPRPHFGTYQEIMECVQEADSPALEACVDVPITKCYTDEFHCDALTCWLSAATQALWRTICPAG